jgi:hypothetical protein
MIVGHETCANMLAFGIRQTFSADRGDLFQNCRCRCYMIRRMIGLGENRGQESPLTRPLKPKSYCSQEEEAISCFGAAESLLVTTWATARMRLCLQSSVYVGDVETTCVGKRCELFNDTCITEKAKEIPKHGRATELTL